MTHAQMMAKKALIADAPELARAGGRPRRGPKSRMTDSALNALPLFERVSAAPEAVTDGAGQPFGDLVQDFSQFGQPSVEVREGPIRYLIAPAQRADGL
jgi:hypothetical protein